MIVKTTKGYIVYSKDKKRIGEPCKTRAQAVTLQGTAEKIIVEGGTYGGKGD